ALRHIVAKLQGEGKPSRPLFSEIMRGLRFLVYLPAAARYFVPGGFLRGAQKTTRNMKNLLE
ncbi:MAG TPA: hypothetical protein PKK78_02935, partial [Kouleothrix sp.]|nr:hypothetical protein [Kouleothrix sp.]